MGARSEGEEHQGRAVKRRELVLAAAAAGAFPFAVRSQQRIPVIGYLGTTTAEQMGYRIPAFKQGLSEAGFVEGRNVVIEYRWAEGKLERLPELAADFVKRGVNVIVTPGSLPAALAAKATTTTIPVVFETGADPVASGLVASLQRPGGNVTGVTALTFEVVPKRLELLHELLPKAVVIGHLINPSIAAVGALRDRQQEMTKSLLAAAQARGLQVQVVHVSSESDFPAAFVALKKARASGVVISPDTLVNAQVEQLAQLSVRHALPAVFQGRQFAAAGGLAGYGGSIPDSHRVAGLQTARVLKGEKPGDLPVQQATKIELFLNSKTAKALNVALPPAVIARADEVIG